MATLKILGEPGGGDRRSIFHKKIVEAVRIPGTQAGWDITLECGHRASVFGAIERAQGRIICMPCMEEKSEKAGSN